MNSPRLRTVELRRYYRSGSAEVHAVDGVDLSISRGDFVGLVGASGSGKSTILNLMAGLDSPTSGYIEFDGTSLSSLTRRELAAYRALKVGMVFQTFNLISHHTALRNIEMALYFNHTTKKERRRRATEVLERLGLGDRITHKPNDLSGGEQQRVAVARAIVKNPAILFADEPTGNLDHDNTKQIGNLLADLNRQGLTIILVTHDLELAREYVHRTVRMHYGRLVDDARTPPALEEKP